MSQWRSGVNKTAYMRGRAALITEVTNKYKYVTRGVPTSLHCFGFSCNAEVSWCTFSLKCMCNAPHHQWRLKFSARWVHVSVSCVVGGTTYRTTRPSCQHLRFVLLRSLVQISGLETGYPDWGFSWCSSGPQGKYRKSILNYVTTSSFRILAILYSFIIL
jgi:hypothetical protein